MDDCCKESGNQKQTVVEKNESVKNQMSPKSTPKRGRKRKQRFCSPKISPAISIQDDTGLISDELSTESEDIQSPLHTPRRLKKVPVRRSPRNPPQHGKRRNLKGVIEEEPDITTNEGNKSCKRKNNDKASCQPNNLTTNVKSSSLDENHTQSYMSVEQESTDLSTKFKEQEVHMHRNNQTESQGISNQLVPSHHDLLLAKQNAAEVMARMNCLEKDEDILDVEKEDSREGSAPAESSKSLEQTTSNVSREYVSSSYNCRDTQGTSISSANQQTDTTVSNKPTEHTNVDGHSVKSMNKPDAPQNGDLQTKGDVSDMNAGKKGTILSSLLEGRDQESLIAAELLTRLDRDIHLSEIQPTLGLEQPNYSSYNNISSSPTPFIGVNKYLEPHTKKQCNTDAELNLQHPHLSGPVNGTYESHSEASVHGENGAETNTSASNSLSTPATRQTASQILYQNRAGQEQLGQECQRSHSFNGTIDNTVGEQGRVPRHSNPGALGWEQGQINIPPPQHNSMGMPGWEQRQQPYHQIIDTANQKDPMTFPAAVKQVVQHEDQLAAEQISNGYRYGPMIPENSPYNHSMGRNKQFESSAMYDSREQHNTVIPVEQGIPFGPMVEDPRYNGLQNFQPGNYLNLSQDTLDNIMQNHGSSYVGSPSLQSQPLPTNNSTPDQVVQGFGDYVSYPRSSQSSEDQVQYFQPIRSKSQGPEDIGHHMAKRRRRSTSARADNNKSPAFVQDVMSNYMFKKKPMPFEHPLNPLQKENDDRFFLVLSPEVNADEVRDIGHKGLIAKYIDYLIVENEQITEMSKSVSIPIEHCVMDDPYLMDIIRVKIPFPTLKYYQWLRTYYPTIQIDWLALNEQMLQFQPVGDCRPHHYILDKRPPPVLLGESFYFFQRERDRLFSC
ncbi:uncharacterized protein [Argopecten irradians]|uniref:uncharacterized protein n=1 Tax=Argopecten irradians TaxID=31199 RepID=UPI00370F8D5F